MKIVRVAWKTLQEMWREPQIFWLLLLFPAMMVGIYYIGYGNTEQGMSQFLVLWVCNRDAGPRGSELVQAFQGATYEGAPLYQVIEAKDCAAGERALLDMRAAAMLTIPADFSARLAGGEQAVLDWQGDAQADTYVFASSFAGSVIQSFLGQPEGAESLVYEFVGGTGGLNDFQIGVPGVMVFGVLLGALAVALVLSRERVNGTLQRLRLAGMGSGDLIGGIVLANMLLGMVQSAAAFGLALACGFNSQGSLWLAGGIVAVVSLTASGLGAAAAAFSKNDGEASLIATGLFAPFVFLSGAVFPMPVARLFEVGERVIQPYDIFPTAHATNALKRILIYGEGAGAVVYELVMLALLTGVVLGIGVWLYRRVMR